ncbi:hypothetical protein [Sedimentitalea todarodis]|uniref:Glycosyltransferase RgtA/B/C/D-like domain-containing protein n=1 Tax=Sedimentitalea todarodis TaxID=1631240 RepID=A0ABU3VDR1_9RHOB|nr:hypothetical protein [Sedimentitalea todarodis]MDU9004320.1 hypothetical protein [Sedimentitalea todarodis]
MTSAPRRGVFLFSCAALACGAILVAAVIWASDRGFDITDEAYYILSAKHPDKVQLYISAQHWILAPLWSLVQSLQGFRLIGMGILVLSASVLGLGALRVADELGLTLSTPLTRAAICAAGAVGALLYVSTIAPSPSYNLLAAAGAYAGVGFALLCVPKSPGTGRVLLLASLAGAALAVGFLNKPSAGVCAGVLASLLLLTLATGGRKWLLLVMIGFGGVATLAVFYLVQPAEPPVLDSLRDGFALFRIVQSEPIVTRLLRYAATMGTSMGESIMGFAPALAFVLLFLVVPRWWSAVLIPLALVVSIVDNKHYLGGRSSYHDQMEALFIIMLVLCILGTRHWTRATRPALLCLGLLALPYCVAIGTGNALFTQVIVSLGGWSVLAVLIATSTPPGAPHAFARQSTAAILLGLITVQVLSSYTRDPYHLAAPLTGQTEPTPVAGLGTLRLDPKTTQMLAELSAARDTCEIAAGTDYLGLYNVPGLALLLEATPPLSPWLNNIAQLHALLPRLQAQPKNRLVIALTPEAQGVDGALPDQYRPLRDTYQYCGDLFEPYVQETIEIWATKPAPS